MTHTTQLTQARARRVTPAMRAAAAAEKTDPSIVRSALASGAAVLPFNPAHQNLKPLVVGRDFSVKVNANIGRSTIQSTLRGELNKLKTALDAGADCVMDLSVGPGLAKLRQRLLEACPVPFGTVPVYEAVSRSGKHAQNFDPELLFDVITEQAEQGVDFMTLHAGLLLRHIPLAMKRKAGIVSRGGAIMARWMSANCRENPLFERWDEVLTICRKHDVTVSLGDGLRPGCLADAGDRAQFAELQTLGELVKLCRAAGVQVMVEGPGHVPFDQIPAQVARALRVCDNAPFYVLGPIVTDIAAGHDHIAAAIGATSAAYCGASLLCYVTPAEHLGLPDAAEVRDGIIAFRIAAHAADIAKHHPGARERDDAMTDARKAFDWKRQFQLALDQPGAQQRFRSKMPKTMKFKSDHCSMCGVDFCAMRVSTAIARDRANKHKS